MGNVYAKKGEYEKALEQYDQVIFSLPGYAIAYLNRGLTKELLGDLQGACSDWKLAFDLGIQDAKNYLKECDQQ
jgi:tetratricopeptide (TPR) repeat protein